MKTLVKSMLLGLSSIVLFALFYQAYSTYSDSLEFSKSGQTVDVGGYHLYVEQQGTGDVTVVFDAGMGEDFSAWYKVSSEVSQFAKVIGYDRAGLGWSDKGVLPRDSETIVDELHTLLEKLNVTGPLILVGHSFGGVNMQLYSLKYPEQVRGLVLVDSAHQEQIKKMPPANRFRRAIFRAGMWAAPLGVPRLYLSSQNPVEKAKKSTTKHQYTSLDEADSFAQSLGQLAALQPNFGNLPVKIIARGQPSKDISEAKARAQTWAVLQEDIHSRSTQSEIIFTGKKRHAIHKTQPQLVVSAIKALVQSSST